MPIRIVPAFLEPFQSGVEVLLHPGIAGSLLPDVGEMLQGPLEFPLFHHGNAFEVGVVDGRGY